MPLENCPFLKLDEEDILRPILPIKIDTGNGETIAFAHTTKFEIYHPSSFEWAYTVEDTPIDFMPNLHVVLLGVNNFLSKFVLNIDYPINPRLRFGLMQNIIETKNRKYNKKNNELQIEEYSVV